MPRVPPSTDVDVHQWWAGWQAWLALQPPMPAPAGTYRMVRAMQHALDHVPAGMLGALEDVATVWLDRISALCGDDPLAAEQLVGRVSALFYHYQPRRWR